MTTRPYGDRVGTTPVSNMTGLPLFLSAALEDCRSLGQAQSLTARVSVLVGDPPLDEQAVVDQVVGVMGRTWRPSTRWRERLIAIGRYDLASW